MEIIKNKISKQKMAEKFLSCFKTVTKVVVDIEKEVIAIDGELHADLETFLLENGSKQEDLWGINLYPF
jgi:translation initiation factor 1 (eIF-1/SUI1)